MQQKVYINALPVYCLLFCFLWSTPLLAQENEVEIEVYDFSDGLSHRNVFKMAQDRNGFIWMATINGLNRFDGYDFITFSSRSESHYIPHDAVTDLVFDPNGYKWLAHPDYLFFRAGHQQSGKSIKVKQGDIIRRESVVPHNLHFDSSGKLWMATYDERSARTRIQILHSDTLLQTLFTVPGQYPQRPITNWQGDIYLAAHERDIWILNELGEQKGRITLPGNKEDQAKIVQLQTHRNGLWALLDNGQVFVKRSNGSVFEAHPLNELVKRRSPQAAALFVDEKENIWIGGRGVLWFYDTLSKRMVDYDAPVRQQVKNMCTYRHIFQDRSGTIWVSSDFGAIKIVQSDRLFSHYLSGGSEYCSNVFCSIRGMTEDGQGRIYISYYNSIHVLDPQTNTIRLLFPSNDFFNFPFGLFYHQGALWTGNGRRINLSDLGVDTLLHQPQQDLGSVIADRNGTIWIGYMQGLYQFDASLDSLVPFEDSQGRWDSLTGRISFLYESPNKGDIWVGTLETGLYKIEGGEERSTHYHNEPDSPAQLNSNQINVVYEDHEGIIWLGTSNGLHRLNANNNELQTFGPEEGLPNHFINGMLPEGDSVLWISTDNGLSRFSLSDYSCTNFSTQDGLSANEFNRISFYKAQDGRMYFGGLDGVNAFYPSTRFLEESRERREMKLLLTSFSRLDGDSDQLFTYSTGLDPSRPISLSYNDRTFSFDFALADYRQPSGNQYSYRLEGYDVNWTPASTVRSVRYNHLPAGDYIFRVRARAPEGEWNRHQLAIPIRVEEAYFRTWWFWATCGGLLLIGLYGVARYRIYTIRQNEKALEKQVQERTQELMEEKQKSEELLLNILPAGLAEELKINGHAKAKRHEMVTVMFSDFKGFSRIAQQLDPETLVAEIDYCFRAFDRIVEKHQLEKIKTIGDAYMCVNGIDSHADEEDAMALIKAALEMQSFLEHRAAERKAMGLHHFDARIGVHTGPVVAGIVGIKKFAYDIWGDTVNVASRMESNGQTGKVNISAATYELVKHMFKCTYHGQFEENNNTMKMYWVESLDLEHRVI